MAAGQRKEPAALLHIVERLHLQSDEHVRELATIGYLEDLQGALDRQPGLTYDDVLPLLGEESRKSWRALERFWSGESSTVRLE